MRQRMLCMVIGEFNWIQIVCLGFTQLKAHLRQV